MGEWEDRRVWVEQRMRMIGKSLIGVIDVVAEIRGGQDGVLGPKYKLWDGFEF